MSSRGQSMPPMSYDKIPKQRGRCVAAICVSWKVFTCVFSHVMLITLVVSYCIFGAFTFEYLESQNEKTIKKGIAFIRGNLTEAIWKLTYEEMEVLKEDNWIKDVSAKLQIFETDILNSMKIKGWDGNEDENKMQWTFSGALFYSIIVITTIGYGHISPKTYMGKLSTICYAILGIPLMLLCLSNIGDIMASSFRFLYWRVCCFVCTREPKRQPPRRPRRGASEQYRPTLRPSTKSNQSMRRSVRLSQRTTDSGYGPSYNTSISHAYSDTELRYNTLAPTNQHYDWEPDRNFNNRAFPNKNQRFSRTMNRESHHNRHTVERDRNVTKPSSNRGRMHGEGPARAQSAHRDTSNRHSEVLTASSPRVGKNSRNHDVRAQSLDPRGFREVPIDFDDDFQAPVLCNKYAIDHLNKNPKVLSFRCQSMPRNYNKYKNQSATDIVEQDLMTAPQMPPHHPSQSSRYSQQQLPRIPHSQSQLYAQDDVVDLHNNAKKTKRRERHVPPHPPSPRIMSPMGFAVHRQARMYFDDEDDDNEFGADDWDHWSDKPSRVRPVPIWLCVFLVVSYIIAGAFLFSSWEGWSFLDSAYFCFITLTTIGFGDFVPAQGVKENPEVSIAFCSLYLLFGIALLAMSFNLVQEEVISNVKNVARRLGILKEEENY